MQASKSASIAVLCLCQVAVMALGVWAMARLRAHPESRRLANGRR